MKNGYQPRSQTVEIKIPPKKYVICRAFSINLVCVANIIREHRDGDGKGRINVKISVAELGQIIMKTNLKKMAIIKDEMRIN